MWDSSWQFHKNRKFNWSGNCANYLFIILTDETGKKLRFVSCKCNNIKEQWTNKKKLGHVKQTDICHYMVYSNIILNLSISTCYMVNHTCDFKSKLAACARSILKSCIWFWTKVALSSILPLYMCLSFLLSISHSLLRSLSQYVIKGCIKRVQSYSCN